MSWWKRLFTPVSAIDVAHDLHDVILDLDANLYDSEHRHHPISQALAAYRDCWVEATNAGEEH